MNRELFKKWHKESAERGVPNITEQNAKVLQTLLRILKPERVLELGTANGISTLFFAEILEEQGRGHIDTIERTEADLEEARNYAKELGQESRISFHHGAVLDVLPELQGTYDFIFVDAMKREYGEYLRQGWELLAPGGLMVFDDVIKWGHKMEDLWTELEARGNPHVILPTDPDDGILLLTKPQ